MLTIQVTLVRAEGKEVRSITVSPTERVADVLIHILRQFGIDDRHAEADWGLWHKDAPLNRGSTLHELKLDGHSSPVVLELRQEPGLDLCIDEDAAPADYSELPDASEFELALDDADADEDVVVDSLCESEQVEEPRAKPRSRAGFARRRAMIESRRATVRYYDRMNPERLFPLLVILTKDIVARIEGAQQTSSGPFDVETGSAIVVEPILPGCSCYPPKMSVLLDRGNMSLTFYVAPNVLGTVEGAKIVVTQNDRPLAEMPLEIKVVKKTWVYVLSGASLLLPFMTSLAKHFGLDFASQHERGFDLYLSFARILVGVSPLFLMAALMALAAVAYWILRPRQRTSFWDVTVLKPEEMLRKINERMKNEPEEAARDLVDLLKAYPSFQPAFLLYGQWHFDWQNPQEALRGFERAIGLGPVKASHYQRAALAASRLGLNRKALSICKEATSKLRTVPGAIWFNMGCYHARLQELDQVIPCLQKALAAGFKKAASYRSDPDLEAVRARNDFQSLLRHPALAGQP